MLRGSPIWGCRIASSIKCWQGWAFVSFCLLNVFVLSAQVCLFQVPRLFADMIQVMSVCYLKF